MKPRIFLSGVTAELGSARDLASVVLRRLGYEPVDMRVFPTGAGDLGQFLRGEIDKCEGMIHLVGHAYGSEPPEPDPYKGRHSHTQLEQLYAEQRGIKTWVFLLSGHDLTDLPRDQLDLPKVPNHPDPLGYQQERRERQLQWRARLEHGSPLLFHKVGSEPELENTLHGIKDELAALRASQRRWQNRVLFLLVALILLGGATWASLLRQGERILDGQKAVEEPPPAIADKVRTEDDDIKRRLHDSLETIYEREVKSAETQKGWKDKDEAENAARTKRDYRRGLADAFVDSLRASSRADGARPELAEVRRLLKDHDGDVKAIRYLDAQESRLLAEAEKNLRMTLTPLLEGVRLHVIRGEYLAAKGTCEKLLAKDADWPDLLLEYAKVLIQYGDDIHSNLYIPAGAIFADGSKIAVAGYRPKEMGVEEPVNTTWHLNPDIPITVFGPMRVTRDKWHFIDDPIALAADRKANREFELALDTARRLVSNDPENGEARFVLGEALLRRLDVAPPNGTRTESDSLLDEAHDLFLALCNKRPADVRYQTQLADTLWLRCLRLFKRGKTTDGIRDLDRSIEIGRWIVSMHPKKYDQVASLIARFTLAIRIQRRRGDTAKALDYTRSSYEAVESARRGEGTDYYDRRVKALQESVTDLESVVAATGDWNRLLQRDAASLPRLLTIRAREFADAGRLRDAAQAADKLRELPASTLVPDSGNEAESAGPTAPLNSRYCAARAYCSCAAIVGKGKDILDEEERATKEKYLALSVACLKESVAGGFDNFEYLEADESFIPLRDRPAYKALFPRK